MQYRTCVLHIWRPQEFLEGSVHEADLKARRDELVGRNSSPSPPSCVDPDIEEVS